ncbi:MAG: proteasome accessory factor PafA2 family protein, partial [Nitrospinaceae bacterium]
PVEESMRLLQICPLPSVFQAWAYSRERTHLDMRGFSVERLAQDEEEDEFCEEDRRRPYTYLEMKCDRVLSNGARFYNDHTHPEYGTPECASLFDLVAHDLAGEAIVRECVRLRNKEIGGAGLQVFKNNTDYHGHSYGTHDNYLIPRQFDFATWVRAQVPFLVTRQLYAGAGKVGAEGKHQPEWTGLQLSQRSDFIETVMSIETMTQRPIVNTRDEPHAPSADYRRLHLILGDANMSPYATALKVGTTRQVLRLIGEGRLGAPPVLADPVADCRSVSRDLSGRAPLRLESGGTMTPLDIQEWYLDRVEAQAPDPAAAEREEWAWVVHEWRRTLQDHRDRPEALADRIDWAMKKRLFEDFMAAEKVTWEDPVMQSLDLEYHNLDPDRGLYYGLGEAGAMFLDPEQVHLAQQRPPADTRALVRGRLVEQERDRIRKIHWTGVEFDNGDFIDLTDVIHPEDVANMLNSSKESCA